MSGIGIRPRSKYVVRCRKPNSMERQGPSPVKRPGVPRTRHHFRDELHPRPLQDRRWRPHGSIPVAVPPRDPWWNSLHFGPFGPPLFFPLHRRSRANRRATSRFRRRASIIDHRHSLRRCSASLSMASQSSWVRCVHYFFFNRRRASFLVHRCTSRRCASSLFHRGSSRRAPTAVLVMLAWVQGLPNLLDRSPMNFL